MAWIGRQGQGPGGKSALWLSMVGSAPCRPPQGQTRLLQEETDLVPRPTLPEAGEGLCPLGYTHVPALPNISD